MPERSIICEDCGQPYPTSRANTKYCGWCRLRRQLTFFLAKTSKCVVCDAKYAPLFPQDRLCSGCQVPWPNRDTCGSCKRDDRPVYRRDIKLCQDCIYSSEKRPAILKAVLKKVRARAGAK